MSPDPEQFDVRQIGPGTADHLAALHLALHVVPSHASRPAPSVADLVSNAESRSMPLDLVYGAYRGDRLVASAVATEFPGGAALVFCSGDASEAIRGAAGIAALRALRVAALRRCIRLLQALVPPGTPNDRELFAGAGFRKLTRLLYLTRKGNELGPSDRAAHDLAWVGYTEESAPLFRLALDLSYVESLDCPELTGLRPTADVLAGHRATGVFDPGLWWVATRKGEPVGISLVNRVDTRATFEIVYLGVARDARGTGVGDALLDRILCACRALRARRVMLAVDCRNDPALGMYGRWGFVKESAMDAWIASAPDDGI